MNKKDLKVLEEAIKASPNNIALRLTYALKLFKLKEFEESEKNFQFVLKLDSNNIKAKQGLVELYFAKNNYSAVIVIAEELSKLNAASEKMLELYAKSLLRQNSLIDAQEVYDRILKNNPFYFDEELDSVLEDSDEYLDDNGEFSNYSDDEDFEDEEMDDFFDNPFLGDDSYLFLPESELSFNEVVGHERAKSLFRFKMPILHSGMPRKGSHKFNVLLFGPYGCGKNQLVRALPFELDTKLLPFGIDRLTDYYNFKPEGLLHYFFGKMRLNKPCIMFIDNVDRYALDRSKCKSMEEHLTTSKFLEEIDGLRFSDEPQYLVTASNTPWTIDPAFFRPGRFDYQELIAPPNQEEREMIINNLLRKNALTKAEISEIASLTHMWSYAELTNLLDRTDFTFFLSGNKRIMKKIQIDAIVAVIEEIQPSSLGWFQTFMSETPKELKGSIMYKQVEKYLKDQKINLE